MRTAGTCSNRRCNTAESRGQAEPTYALGLVAEVQLALQETPVRGGFHVVAPEEHHGGVPDCLLIGGNLLSIEDAAQHDESVAPELRHLGVGDLVVGREGWRWG